MVEENDRVNLVHKNQRPDIMPLMRLALLCLLALGLASCDQDTFIDPFSGQDRYYTVYGYLDTEATDHFIRVIPVRRTPEAIASAGEAQAFIDATVTTTDLTTGIKTTWTPTLKRLENGDYAHVFQARFIPQGNRVYRLEVERSDGKITSAETRIPLLPESVQPVLGPIKVVGDSLTQSVYLPEIPSPAEVKMMYQFSGDTQLLLATSYGRAGTRTDDGGWAFTAHLTRDQQDIWPRLRDSFISEGLEGEPQFLNQNDLPMLGMGVFVSVLDENWNPPNGTFAPDFLSQPNTLSNVENGYGFFGSIGYLIRTWDTTPELSQQLGYR